MKPIIRTLPFFTAFFLMLASPTYALLGQSIDSWQSYGHIWGRYFPQSGVENDTNELQVTEAAIDFGFDINVNKDVRVDLDFTNKHVFLDSNAAGIDLPSVLVGRAMRLGVNAPLDIDAFPGLRWGVAVIPTYYTDSWDDSFQDFEYSAFRWQSDYYLEYPGDDQFSWMFGVRVRPDYDQAWLPIVGFDYAFTDQWSVRLTSDDAGIVYHPNDEWKIFTEHRYVLDEFEISSGGQDGRPLRHKQNTTGLGLSYSPNDSTFIKVSGGYAYNRSFKFVDTSTNTARVDDAFYVSLEYRLNF